MVPMEVCFPKEIFPDILCPRIYDNSILADKTAELRCLTREYSTYNERIWSDLLGEDPKVLAKYYYDLNNSFFEFEEYDIYSEFERLVARLFVRHR